MSGLPPKATSRGQVDEGGQLQGLPARGRVDAGLAQRGLGRPRLTRPTPASAARSVLRRWANAASITANTSARLSPSGSAGAGRRTSRSRLESTLGTGQNTPRPTVPARVASAYQASFTLGTPYTRLPGAAASRSATSACTITRPLRRVGSSSSRCSRIGTDTL